MSGDITMKKKALTTKEIVYIGIFAALMAICAWITIPTVVPFTLQTFGVFLAISLLGGKNGTISVIIYILLGAVGLPVFSGFKGGIGALLGTTGGYIIGFVLTAIIMWASEVVLGKKTLPRIISMVVGLFACYALGTAWFMIVYAQKSGPIGLMTTLGWCVFPFIIPDCIKIAMAFVLSKRLEKHIDLR